MKTTKTSIGNVPGKDGDEDPNKDRWTFGYKSSHANDNSIKSELRETGGLIVKLLKLVNKWLNVLYEKQLEKLEKYKKK